MAVTTNDAAWVEGLERAAQRLRAAAASFLTQGGEVEDLWRIVQDGATDVEHFGITQSSRETMRKIGYRPNGADRPAGAQRPAA